MKAKKNETDCIEESKNRTFYSKSNSSTKKIRADMKFYSTSVNKRLPFISTSSTFFPRTFYQTSMTTSSNFYNPIYNMSTDGLKQELSNNRDEINSKKNEYQEIKIKFKKLFEDNKTNRSVLAKILGVGLDKEFTKDEIINKLERCRPSSNQKKTLKELHEVINLKLDVDNLKEILMSQKEEIGNLKKGTKAKAISDLENEVLSKKDEIQNLEVIIKKMEEGLKENQKDISYLINEYNYQKDYHTRISRRLEKSEEMCMNTENDKVNLNNEIIEICEKQKKMKEHLKRKKINKEIQESINQKNEKLSKINDYKKTREDVIKSIDEKKKENISLNKQKKSQEKKIKLLSEKNNELSEKLFKYNEEKPKLIKKSKEDPKNIVRMQNLEEELAKLQKLNEKLIEDNSKKNQELQKANNQEEKELEKHKNISDKNNAEREELNKNLDTLHKEITELNSKIAETQKEIEEQNKLIENFLKSVEEKKKQQEKDRQLQEEENQKNEENLMKELNKKEKENKKEIDSLTRQNKIQKNENDNLEKENKNLQTDIDDLENELKQYSGIDEKLENAQNELNRLKKS